MINALLFITSVAAVCATIALIVLGSDAPGRHWPCTADFTHRWINFEEVRARRCFECGTWQVTCWPTDTSDGQSPNWFWKTVDYDPRTIDKSLRDFRHGRWRNAKDILAELRQ
jgi:hypothetical protein